MTSTDHNPLMTEAWASFVLYAVTVPQWREQFYADTGMQIDYSERSTLHGMIDKATGAEHAVMERFVDWATENLWGTEDVGVPQEVLERIEKRKEATHE